MASVHRLPTAWLVVASAALACASCADAPAPRSAAPPPAPTPTAPAPADAAIPEEIVTETFFGTAVSDPYRWMENKADPRFVALMKREGDKARAALDALPDRKALYDRVHALSGGGEVLKGVVVANGRVFYEKRPVGAETSIVYVRPVASGAERVLIDPAKLGGEGAHLSLDVWSPSPDGKYVVFGTSPAGSEDSTATIAMVDTGELLPERIDRFDPLSVSWLPDSSGFFLLRRREGAKIDSEEKLQNEVNWLHRLRTDPAKDKRILAKGVYADLPVDAKEFPTIYTAPGSPWVIAMPLGGVRKDNPVYLAKLTDLTAGKPRWTRVAGIDDEVRVAAVRGDDLFLLTTKGADRGKVLQTRASAPDLAKAKVVVAEGVGNLSDVIPTKDAVYVAYDDAGYSGLLRLEASKAAPVKLPIEGAFSGYSGVTSEDGIVVCMASWFQPTAAWQLKKGAAAELPLARRPTLDLSGYEVVRTTAKARDGVKVPVTILAKKGLARDGSAPALVYAYGAYQWVLYPPSFDASRVAFLERGGIIAYAGVRGGGEYGKPWWKAGQKLQKPNTWRDLIDASEAMIKDGWTRPQRLAIEGYSAGGVTAGRAMTERPDLFAGVILRAGMVNALRAEFNPNGPTNIDEFGTVTEADGFKGLLAMDVTQSVKAGTAYPAVLFIQGMTDARVEPWQSAKLLAHLRKASTSNNPLIMRVTYDEGHLEGTRAQDDEEAADTYAFVLSRSRAAR
ncbi:MAG TPA: prolyl oligopeptidase family serine peptidase [Byssovorax sp.]